MITIVLAGIIIVQAVLHQLERRDLYNRIMCGSLMEYKSKKTSYTPSASQKVLERWRAKKGGDS